MNQKEDVENVLELLREAFNAHLSRLEDHHEFIESGEGIVKKYVKPQNEMSAEELKSEG